MVSHCAIVKLQKGFRLTCGHNFDLLPRQVGLMLVYEKRCILA
jgi:hypothetical protein